MMEKQESGPPAHVPSKPAISSGGLEVSRSRSFASLGMTASQLFPRKRRRASDQGLLRSPVRQQAQIPRKRERRVEEARAVGAEATCGMGKKRISLTC